jgi:hypothetical protein
MRALQAVRPQVKAIAVTSAELPCGSPEPPDGKARYAGSRGLGHGIRQPFMREYDHVLTHRAISYPEAVARGVGEGPPAGAWKARPLPRCAGPFVHGVVPARARLVDRGTSHAPRARRCAARAAGGRCGAERRSS